MGSRPATSGRVVASTNGTAKSDRPLLNGKQKNGAARRRTGPAGAPAIEPAVKLVALHKSYGRNLVLKGVNFAVAPGELVEVTGPSGSGKTTLLRLVHGQLRPSAGELWVQGRSLHRRWRETSGATWRSSSRSSGCCLA